MKNLILALALLCTSVHISSQSYRVEIDSLPYDTLREYTSLGLEKAMVTPIYFEFEQEFEFGFGFPYFDTILHSFIFQNYSIGDIEGCLEYPMYLFSKEFNLHIEEKIVPNLDSDFRYISTDIDGKKVFIFEFKKVVYEEEPDEPKFSRNHFSFQHWFWENGDLEIRFGESFILSELYKPGVGIKEQFTGNYYPFALTISNYDLDENIHVSGNLNDNPSIAVTDNWDQDFPGITNIPEKNTVCRFKKLTSKTKDKSTPISMASIVHDQINIPEDYIFENYIIFDIMGNPLLSGKSNIVDTQGLNAGSYILLINHIQGNKTHRFIKM